MRLLRLPVRRRPRLRARFLLAVAGRLRGLRGLLEAQAEELVAQCVAHGELRLRGGAGKLCLTRRGRVGAAPAASFPTGTQRAEERRVGEECVSTYRYRGSPDP